jgi:flagellar protein FlaI
MKKRKYRRDKGIARLEGEDIEELKLKLEKLEEMEKPRAKAKEEKTEKPPRKRKRVVEKLESDNSLQELGEKLAQIEEMGEFKIDEEVERLRSIYKGIEPKIEGELTGLEKEAEIEEEYDAKKFGPLVSFEGLEGYTEIERYWIEKPYCFAVILFNEKTSDHLYYLVEPALTDVEKSVFHKIQGDLRDRLPYEAGDREKILTQKFSELIREYGILDQKSIHKLLYLLKRNNLGYGKIDGLMKDKSIEDISCDGPDTPIFLYHRKFYSVKTNISFARDELDDFVVRIVERCGKHISIAKPVVDTALPDGSRLQATLGTEVTAKGSSFSIRKFLGATFTPVDLIKFKTFSPEMLAHLWIAAENRKNILIIGGTASGKTSTLNALAFFIPPMAKIVSIEDTREISLYQENWIASVTREAPGEKRIDMQDLVRQALRQRPECIIVGEIRGEEALALFQAASTGHTVYSTMHAGSVQEAVHRLEGEPMNVPRPMLASLNIVCVQILTNVGKERARRNQSTVEFAGVDPATKELRIVETFTWDPYTDSFKQIGESHVLREIARERGWSIIDLEREISNRTKILTYMAEKNITQSEKIAEVIRTYFYSPEKILKEINAAK